MFNVSIRELYVSFFSFFIFLMMGPYYIWGNQNVLLSVFLLVATALFTFVSKKVSSKRFIMVLLLFFLVYIYMLMVGSSYLGALSFSISLGMLFLMDKVLFLRVFERFKVILAVALVPAILLWFLHHSI